MGSDMNEAAFRAEFSQLLLSGFRAHKKPGAAHGFCNKTRLFGNIRSPRIRNGQNQRTSCARRRLLLLAHGKDAAAGRIGDGKIIDQISLAVRKSMKRQIVQESVGNDDKVLSLELLSHRLDKERIKLFQVRLRGFQE